MNIIYNNKMFSKKYSLFLVVLSVVLVLFLILDFTYSKFFTYQKNINIRHKTFHHHLLSNSTEIQGGGLHPKFKVITNSLGFRDSKIREINLKKKNRIVFIGDAFTFGELLDYKYTVPGLADIYFSEKGIEVLNAAVSSYSPSIYYYKTKFFIEQGLKFSNLVVFVDISDIEDEAVRYVVDEQNQSVKDQQNQSLKDHSEKHNPQRPQDKNLKKKFKDFLIKNFNITYTFLKFIDDNILQNNFLDIIASKLFPQKKIEFIDYIVSEKYIRDNIE
jgi:hypothetical protein